MWDFEAQCIRASKGGGCGWLVISKAKEDEDGYSVPFHVVKTAAGSLVVRAGHPGDGTADGAAETAGARPWALDTASETELRIFREVCAYVKAHGTEDTPLSFRRIDQGVKGNQNAKRRMLDEAAGYQLLGIRKTGANESYFYPGSYSRFLDGRARWLDSQRSDGASDGADVSLSPPSAEAL